jgi:hypothetical protein
MDNKILSVFNLKDASMTKKSLKVINLAKNTGEVMRIERYSEHISTIDVQEGSIFTNLSKLLTTEKLITTISCKNDNFKWSTPLNCF